ncbi:MAG: hypothetical protein OSB07_08975 [Dehalococcoidia bacterium]|nr:hypothetical protein [Dehalococcoidia bacterium]
MGFLDKFRKGKSDSDDEESGGGGGKKGGRFGGILGKVKGMAKRGNGKSLDDDDDVDAADDDDNDDDEQPIRRSGIAAALDGKDDEEKESGDADAGPGGMADLGMDMESLFEEEFIADPMLQDLAESMEYVSAVELAADLMTFVEELSR